jgi:hypothetical protein
MKYLAARIIVVPAKTFALLVALVVLWLVSRTLDVLDEAVT